MQKLSFTKKKILNVLREHMLSTSFDSFFRSEVFSSGMAHTTSTQYSQIIERTVRERATASKEAEVLWHVDGKEVPGSFLGLLQIYSHKTATSPKCNALVAYPVHVMW